MTNTVPVALTDTDQVAIVVSPPDEKPVVHNDPPGAHHSDFLWQNQDGAAALWAMNGLTLTAGANVGFNPGPSWHAIGAGDFDGDGKADILWQNNNGQAAVWLMNGLSLKAGREASWPCALLSSPLWRLRQSSKPRGRFNLNPDQSARNGVKSGAPRTVHSGSMCVRIDASRGSAIAFGERRTEGRASPRVLIPTFASCRSTLSCVPLLS